ncbi:MAG TPA: hypothetical protein VHK88_14645 [Aquihabitans sp.]|jgi:hypothetical protein|nr:hypothetical protein [Aquihabitans sp.]
MSMEWYPYFAWGIEHGSPWDGIADQTAGGSAHRRTPTAGAPTEVDVLLVRLTYEVIAPSSSCARCGQALGRSLRVRHAPGGGIPSHWPLSVRTRCTGWRRHPHEAEVTRRLSDLELGSFRSRSDR